MIFTLSIYLLVIIKNSLNVLPENNLSHSLPIMPVISITSKMIEITYSVTMIEIITLKLYTKICILL